MSESAASVKVRIFDNEYTIKGQADEAYIQQLAAYVNDRMSEIASSTNLTNQLKISILSAINLADEIFRLRNHLKEKHERTTDQLALNEVPGLEPEAIKGLIAHIDLALKENANK